MAEALEPHVSIGFPFTLQSAPHVHRPPFCLERTGDGPVPASGDGHGSWGSDGSRGVTFACHRVRAAAAHNTPEWAGLRPTVLTRTGRGHSPLQLAHPPRRRALDPGRCCAGGVGGGTTPASCWEFPVYKTQTVILAQLRRSRAAIDVKGFVHCKVLGWRKNPCHSRGCVRRLVCGWGGGRGWHGRTS